ncbi:MAG TPA: hypothetical protein VL326_32840 [Kofleriaceae bacterium]|jgi:hypothetical protein|nr:hypothetical protein [Kofleriaceae bacterium]
MLTVAVLAVFAVLVSGGALHARERRTPNAKLRRQLQGMRRVKIAELPESEVGCTIGRTRPLEATPMVEAPLTARPCFYYIVEVEVQTGRSWRLIARERHGGPFIIQDSTGRAVIEPDEARLDIAFDFVDHCWSNPTQREHAFVLRVQPSVVGVLFTNQVRFREAIIGVDELVSVLGAGVREADPLAPPVESYRGEPVMRLRFSSSPEAELVLSAAKETILDVAATRGPESKPPADAP